MSLNEKLFLENLEQNIADLTDSLTTEIDGKKISGISKLPFKVVALAFSLHHRAVDLAENSLRLFKGDNYLASAILIRSLMETTSLVFLTQKKINEVVESKELGEIDDFLMKGLFGGRTEDAPLTSANILTAIDHTDKKYDKYREMYDELSEFAHPNWHGASGLYSKSDFDGKVQFGKNINPRSPKFILAPFLTATTVLLLTFSDFSKNFNEFIKISEDDINKSEE